MMISFVATALSLFAFTTVLGQRVIINPINGLIVYPNTAFTFELDRPTFQSSSVDVAAVVGFQFCPRPESCTDDTFGEILYNGVYRPIKDRDPFKDENQNITVMIPDSPTGFGRLTVTHFALVGVSLVTTWSDTSSVTLTVM